MSVIETLLAETFGVPVDDPRVRGVISALDRIEAINHRAILRHQIQNDPCRDYKVIKLRYHVPTSFVYQSWRLKVFPALKTK